MSLDARWSAKPYSVTSAERVAREAGVSLPLAAILVRRGYDTPAAARRFLAADERHDPRRLAGMVEACARIRGHAERRSRIVVHGDYDVDGVCSTAILVRALRALGADPAWVLPSRQEGYGISAATVTRLAERGTDLLITADCGITAAEEVAAAAAAGIEVVVTDHHRPAHVQPRCPIVHPALGDYPFRDLCAAGVALKLSEALRREAGLDPSAAEEDLDLVGLATIADVVPLRGENRRLAREGLRALSRSGKPGLRALMRVAGVDPGAVGSHAVGHRLAPRLNAAGRLERADAALELLLTDDEERAAAIADELDLLNRERRDEETRILFAAEAARAEQDAAAAYVLAGEGWHPGVIGIVASRMVERHGRPCVILGLDGQRGRGSGRSIPAYDLHEGLSACACHLRRFGGHAAAAGLEIDADQLEPFRRALAAHAGAALAPGDLMPCQPVDAVVPARALDHALAEELRRLEPFGHGNPCPTFLVPAVRIEGARGMGEDGEHARFSLAGGGSRAAGVAFRASWRALAADGGSPRHAAVRLELNEWGGGVEPRVVLRALCPPRAGECRVIDEPGPFWQELDRALEGAEVALAAPGAPCRVVRDHRGEGFAGAAGEILSSGESALILCADVPRRRRGLESLVAGLAPEAAGRDGRGEVAVASWPAFAARPGLAMPYQHLLALDPPPSAAGERLLAAAPWSGAPGRGGDAARGFAHLAWGEPETRFAAAVARSQLDLRAPLTELYRALRQAGPLQGPELEGVLRGPGARPREGFLCGRLLRVLMELQLVSYDPAARSCRVVQVERTALERSPTYRSCATQLHETLAYLSGPAGAPESGSAEPSRRLSA